MTKLESQSIAHNWIESLNEETANAVIHLIDSTVEDGGTLGYIQTMSVTQKISFIEDLQQRLTRGQTQLLLGRVNGVPAFLTLLNLNGMANCRHRAELAKGVVHPSFRGKRLVHIAFAEIVARAEQLKIEQLVLDVRENTRAHRLWQLFGFKTYGVLEDYARVNGQIHRGHFMEQSVASLLKNLQTASF